MNNYLFNHRITSVLTHINRLDATLHFLYVLQRLNYAKFYGDTVYASNSPVVLGFLAKFNYDTDIHLYIIANA